MNKLTGAVVASLVAGMFAVNALAADAAKTTNAKVKCTGVNECKGKGECDGPGHACAGKNECKGKGWVTMADSKTCTDKGGKVAQAEKSK